ncbi:hypothetical protein SprV_0301060200 [Sparganum proliferum]
MGSRRQGGQIRRYKDTLKASMKRVQISPANWEDLTRDRPTLKKTVKKGAAIYEANRTTVVKAKREFRKYQLRPPHNTNAQPPPTCPRCQRTFRALIGLRTSSCQLQHLNYTSRCPPVKHCLVLHADNQR